MIPLNPRLCELVEVALHEEDQSLYLPTLNEFVIELMQQTNYLIQNYYSTWSQSQILIYTTRLRRYSRISQAFLSIKNGVVNREIVAYGLQESVLQYHEINEQYLAEWERSGPERRTEILEEILVPHMLFVRFLEKFHFDKYGEFTYNNTKG